MPLFADNDIVWQSIGQIITAIFAGVSAVIAAVGTLITVLQNAKIKKVSDDVVLNTKVSTAAAVKATQAVIAAKVESAAIQEKVNKTHEAVNGRTTELIETARQAAHADGLAEGLNVHNGIVNRIEKLEGGQEFLVQGQVETKKAIDILVDEIRKQSKH